MTKQSHNLLNLSKAADAVGITRKTLYSHIDKGLVSITKVGGKRFIDVSELIRHYGTVSLPDPEVNSVTPSQTKHSDDLKLELSSLRKELLSLQELVAKQSENMTLLLEDKEARASEKEEMEKLKTALQERDLELQSMQSELDTERSKGFWKRLFKG